MSDLVAFLRARLDEDQVMANRPRVLREVEAKRAILDRLGEPPADLGMGEHLQRNQEQPGLRFAVRHLAAVYSGHPDYRDEWKP